MIINMLVTNQSFLKTAGIACILTAFTTLGVHLVSFPADSFEARLQLSGNNLYLAHRWMIILHCACVIMSMLAIAFIKWKDGPGWMALGFLFYTVFGITEISRMMAVLHYLNPLREQYMATTDIQVQALLKHSIDQFNHVGITLFSIFAFAFTIGNVCYGIVFSGASDRSKWIGIAFLFWGFMGILSTANEFFLNPILEKMIDLNAKIFQPTFRLVLGIWIWSQLKFRKAFA